MAHRRQFMVTDHLDTLARECLHPAGTRKRTVIVEYRHGGVLHVKRWRTCAGCYAVLADVAVSRPDVSVHQADGPDGLWSTTPVQPLAPPKRPMPGGPDDPDSDRRKQKPRARSWPVRTTRGRYRPLHTCEGGESSQALAWLSLDR